MNSHFIITTTLATPAPIPEFKLLVWDNYLLAGLVCAVIFLTRFKFFRPWYSPILACVPLAFLAGMILTMVHPWGDVTFFSLLNVPIYIGLIFGYGVKNFKEPKPLNRDVGYLFIVLGGLGILVIFTSCLAGAIGVVSALCIGLLILTTSPIVFWLYKRQQTRKAFHLTYHCAMCDFDLRGTPQATHCPDCGHIVSLDPEKLKLVFPEDD